MEFDTEDQVLYTLQLVSISFTRYNLTAKDIQDARRKVKQPVRTTLGGDSHFLIAASQMKNILESELGSRLGTD